MASTTKLYLCFFILGSLLAISFVMPDTNFAKGVFIGVGLTVALVMFFAPTERD